MGDYAYHAIGKGAYKHAIFEIAKKTANFSPEDRDTEIAEMVKEHEFCNGYVGRSLAVLSHSDNHWRISDLKLIVNLDQHDSAEKLLQMMAIEAMKADVIDAIDILKRYYPDAD